MDTFYPPPQYYAPAVVTGSTTSDVRASYTISDASKNGQPMIATRFATTANQALRLYLESRPDPAALHDKPFFVRSVTTGRVWRLRADVVQQTTYAVAVKSAN
jgi:hypothetical protein